MLSLLGILLFFCVALPAPLASSPAVMLANHTAKDSELCSFYLKWTQYCDFKLRNHLGVPAVLDDRDKEVTYGDNQYYSDLQPGDRFRIRGLGSDVSVELVRACGRDDILQFDFQDCRWEESESKVDGCGYCESGKWDKEGDWCQAWWEKRVKEIECHWKC